MNRRGFLRLLGLAPVVAVAGAVPAIAVAKPFHTGGVLGETPAILQRGETVLSRHTINVDARGSSTLNEADVRRIMVNAMKRHELLRG